MKGFRSALRENKLLIGVVLTMELISFFVWRYGNGGLSDFGLNFFTEILGVFVTVLIIDYLVEQREKRKLIPVRLAIYHDAQRFFIRFYSFWVEAYRISVPDKAPPTIERFFSDEGIGKVFHNLWLDSQPNVTPPRDWWTWIGQHREELTEKGHKFLERHVIYADPILYKAIHAFCEGTFMTTLPLMNSIRQSDAQFGSKRLHILGNCAPRPQTEDYENMLQVYYWLRNNFDVLKRHESRIFKVSYEAITDENRVLTCRVPDAVVLEYFQEQQKRKS
ncbi:hypothetical protein KK083_13470 [Fulvivirgaceae bacterium PWU4]|uniref:Uncharacterized protein n=1 Tax=Chryseosolibacter histidini TaxID=2782349 RepID=A0AAP2GJ27_9BACT|nr:hypothetical protein [Chryseosolibacter histidini]MBT1697896.1 hypothetical protein [Chryseosolibacter histidini]